MKTKEFREIQISSSLLAFIFLGILALGVFVFLLGVSVGKKQAQIAGTTHVVAQKMEDLSFGQNESPSPGTDLLKTRVDEPGASQKTTAPAGEDLKTEEPKEAKSAPAEADAAAVSEPAPKTPAAAAGLYRIQVGAREDRASAAKLAGEFKAKGFTAVVVDPLPAERKKVYRVRIGTYATREEAAAQIAKFKAADKKVDYFTVKD
ncbi:MAG: SPOR domain-containing protein [Acidobacteriota bacterium]|nr:SPOR domain-containing protein [Acidobacteriota bacterium]